MACESSAASSPCGSSYLTSAAWGAAGGWYAGDIGAVGSYGDWYDPGDTYDPATDTGGVNAGPGDNSGDNTSGDDTSGGDTSGGDTSGGDTSSGDTSQGLTHLAFSTATSPAAHDGCWTCAVGCTTPGPIDQRSGRQAIGVSDASYDDACRSAVQSLEQWSHATLHQPLLTCQQIGVTPPPRTPASPSVSAGKAHVPGGRLRFERAPDRDQRFVIRRCFAPAGWSSPSRRARR